MFSTKFTVRLSLFRQLTHGLIRLSALFYLCFTQLVYSETVNQNLNQAIESLNNVITLTDKKSLYTFTNQVSYFEDKSHNLSFDEIQTPEIDKKFTLVPQDNISLGYIQSSVWLKFTVKNNAKNTIDWRLLLDYPLLDEIVIYSKQENDSWKKTMMGDNYPFGQRPLNHRIFVDKLDIKYTQSQQFYIKVTTTSSMQIRPSITSSETFFINELHNEMFYGIIYGIMLLMAIYNIFLYLAVKDTSYLVYVFSVLSGCIFIMALNGHAYQYLWPHSSLIANKAVPLTPAIWMIFTAVFTQMFLETKRFAPRLYIAMNIQVLLAIISVFISLFGAYQLAIKIATGLALVNGILILATSIVCWKNGNRFARYFVGAWTVYGVGTAMLIISRFGLLPDNFITHNSASLGLLVEIIMLSLALSDKYRVLTKELETHAQGLELKVTQRTAELEYSNKQLVELSRCDSLTGLANRRYLDQQLENEWNRAIRDKTPISMLVADIDQFKNINDHFGHQYGDDCILEVAEILKNTVTRPSDLPARFGGDEFVVMLPNTDENGAMKLGKQISQDLALLTLKQAPNTLHPFISLSIGCATLTPSTTNELKSLFALADKKLYQAKQQGRNTIVS
jgi:diguanylate cyclase